MTTTISTIQSLDPEPGVEPGERIHARSHVSPRSVTALVLRVRALMQEWMQAKVDEESITGSEGVIDDAVVTAFLQAGGDLGEVVPYALLQARQLFVKQHMDDASAEGELNALRALACEHVALGVMKRIEAPFTQEGGAHHPGSQTPNAASSSSVAHSHVCLSKRFVQFQDDGDLTQPTSAMESAVDQNCIAFLASKEAQRCAEELWKGTLVQQFSSSGKVYFEAHQAHDASFFSKMNPARLAVPRYAYYAGLAIHVAFIIVYTFSTLEYTGLDAWEIALWIFAAGYLVEDVTRWIKLGGLDKIISFWVVIDMASDILFLTAFSFRVAAWFEHSHAKAEAIRLLAFQFLSCIAPLLWMQLLKLADGIQYFGVIQIVLLRMLQETAAFFLLLLLTAIGFAQSFFALDAADGHSEKSSAAFIVNLLVAGMLGQPDFDGPSDKFGAPFGSILFYFYAFITVMLLANILVAFFASAYDKTVDAADDVFKAYFCSKVISSIRAPDNFVYYVPFNLVELLFIAPFEFILPRKAYVKINQYIQSVLFCIPITLIALYESDWSGSRARRIYLEMVYDMPEEQVRRMANVASIDNVRDPTLAAVAAEGQDGEVEAVISRRSFKELSTQLPKLSGSEGKEQDGSGGDASGAGGDAPTSADMAMLLRELKALREEIRELKSRKLV